MRHSQTSCGWAVPILAAGFVVAVGGPSLAAEFGDDAPLQWNDWESTVGTNDEALLASGVRVRFRDESAQLQRATETSQADGGAVPSARVAILPQLQQTLSPNGMAQPIYIDNMVVTPPPATVQPAPVTATLSAPAPVVLPYNAAPVTTLPATGSSGSWIRDHCCLLGGTCCLFSHSGWPQGGSAPQPGVLVAPPVTSIAPSITTVPPPVTSVPQPCASILAPGAVSASPYAATTWPATESCVRKRLWAHGQFLYWWADGNRVPALVTTSPDGTPPGDAGVLGEPGTTVLFGNERLNGGGRMGGRVTVGYWLTAEPRFGIEANYLLLESEIERYAAASDGDPILARPYLDIVSGDEEAMLIAYDMLVDGSVSVRASSQFQSGELMARRSVAENRNQQLVGAYPWDWRVDVLAGYRYGRLDDALLIDTATELAGPTMISSFDQFDTSNTFNGAEVGMVGMSRWNRWSLEALAKLAVGNVHSKVLIDGSTTTTVGGGLPAPEEGGLLALSTNIGTYTQNDLSVMPELGLTLGYDITPCLRATFGYTFIYWSQVVRSGDVIDRDVNPSYLPGAGPPAGPARPAFAFQTTDYWAHGMNAGLDFRF